MKRFKKIKKRLRKAPSNWIKEFLKQIKKDPVVSMIMIVFGPILIFLIARIIIQFSVIATIGYILACIIGLTRILKKPNRIMIWGGAYILSALIIIVFTNIFLPRISANTTSDIFASSVIILSALIIFNKIRKLKKR